MRNHLWPLLLLLFCGQLAGTAWAAKYKLKDGTVLSGEPMENTFTTKGLILKYDSGDRAYSTRMPWEAFSQEALQEIHAKYPKSAKFVEFLIEMPAEALTEDLLKEVEKAKKPPIVLKESKSPGRPYEGTGILGAFFSGGGFLLLLLMYGANLYAAYEIGMYRNWPTMVICGASAAVPFIAPLVFLSMPTRVVRKPEEEEEEEQEEEGEEAPDPLAELAPEQVEVVPVEQPKPLPPTQSFKRGEFNLNRRFIETKFAGFFRVIPSEAERDMNLVLKTARGEFIGKRVLRITNEELCFQIPSGAGTVDEVIPLIDIFEIQIRHKDALE